MPRPTKRALGNASSPSAKRAKSKTSSAPQTASASHQNSVSNTDSVVQQTSRLCKFPNELKHMIADLLPLQAVYRLAKCSTDWSDISIPKLYDLDALGNSEAIKWAVTTCAERDPQLALKILAKSIEHKGDVNAVYTDDDGFHATALHYAAAYSRTDLVRELLRLGARVDAWSSGGEFARKLGISALNDSFDNRHHWLEQYTGDWEWSPLVIPILTNDIDTAKLLVGAGATGTIIRHRDNASFFDSLPVVTVHHLLAAAEPSKTASWVHVFDHDMYRAGINVRLHNFSSPLNTAVGQENGPIFNMLMEQGADPNVPTVWGGSALLTAVKTAFKMDLSPCRRKVMMEWMARLIRAGARVNPPANAHETPLGCALELYVTTLDAVDPCVKRTIEILVENGANINLRRPSGHTILQEFCQSILCFKKLRYPPLENMLRYLIASGGDVNIAPADGSPTIIFKSIQNVVSEKQVTPFHAILRDAGAAIHPREACLVFRIWARHAWIRKKRVYNNILQYGKHISHTHINKAWTMAISHDDDQLFQALQDAELMPTNIGELIHKVISKGCKRFWPGILDVGFDADCLGNDKHRGSFLHTLVRRVESSDPTDNPMSINAAAKIAEVCIKMGTSTLIRDATGKLALDLLTEDHSKLRFVLLDAYFRETKETADKGDKEC